ncbi:MAG: calcium-binding protein, partial [Cyanobacteria bacterium J06627_8]
MENLNLSLLQGSKLINFDQEEFSSDPLQPTSQNPIPSSLSSTMNSEDILPSVAQHSELDHVSDEIGLSSKNKQQFEASDQDITGLPNTVVLVNQDRDGLRTRRSTDTFNAQVKGERIIFKGRNEKVVGTSKDDTINASKGKGGNRLYGGKGNDKLIARRNDRLLGQAGNDILEVRGGKKNILKGGKGKDTLIANKQDRLFGDGGKDVLYAGQKNNRLKGGGGKDEFWIASGSLPKRANTILDFKVGTDVIG